MNASPLVSAHRGYQYQDLITAIALVDTLLQRSRETCIDQKLFNGDLFDDLTTIGAVGRQRLQIKHTSDPEAVLDMSVFGSDKRGVRLDRLLAGVIADRTAFPDSAEDSTYRLIFTDHLPASGDLRSLLHPAGRDRDLPLSDLATEVYRFDSTELLELKSQGVGANPARAALANLADITLEELRWACGRLVIETSAPRFSADLLAPAAAEQILLDRVQAEIGVGSFPNADLTPVDVAARLILAAQAARSGMYSPTPESLITRTRLRTDFGAVTAATPVDPDRAVARDEVVSDLVARIASASESGGVLVVEGPPGQGKSWVSDQVRMRLGAHGWLVAEHYCFLGEADGERDDRVVLDAILGSLIARIADADGKLVADNVPRYSADRRALEQSLLTATRKGKRKVVLMVDGLDHISRVLRAHRSTNPSLVVCEALALLDLPPNVVLVVLSQPGEHLAPFSESDRALLPGMNREELEQLSDRLLDGDFADGSESRAKFIDALDDRSAGNALYATYLIAESSRRDQDRFPTRGELVEALPLFDGTLKNYYDYLYAELDSEGWVVAQELAVANFALTRDELLQLRSPSRVAAALRVLSPVLQERVGSGIRFYHESFGRFVRERLAGYPDEIDSLLRTISDWLTARGLFDDQRAFRWLIPMLSEQNRHLDAIQLISDDFVEVAIANAFPVRGITGNLASAAESAARLADWPNVVRLIQMAGGAHTFDFDRFETLVEFTDVQAEFVNPQHIADRLMDGDRLVLTGRQAVLRCAALDRAGAIAPWTECLAAFERERKADNTQRGSADDQQVALAVLRGRFRTVPTGMNPAEFKWKRIAKYLDEVEAPIPDVVDLIADAVGTEHVVTLAMHSRNRAALLLELAEREPEYTELAMGEFRRELGQVGGSAHRAMSLGLEASDVWPDTSKLRHRLLRQTRKVLLGPSSFGPKTLPAWLDLCCYAARLDPVALASAEALVHGDGWYRDWLEFVIQLVRAESVAPEHRTDLALDALRLLARETDPFRGKPRASDLYSAHGTIATTITRALRLVSPERLPEALELLQRVSNQTTTIGMGFAGGPLLADELARIAADVSPVQARATLRAHLLSQIDSAGADTFYPEVAEYHLRLARLETKDGASKQAADHWRTGIALLTAYGSHKDATIYELSEPLEDLIELDRTGVRNALQRLQSITLAVEHHTDGRGTSRVHADWWKEAARADPTWLIDLALPELAAHVNSSHWALQRAVEEVWKFHHPQADARISAAVRVAVDAAILDTDPADLTRYVGARLLAEPGGESLIRALIARFDERATSSTYTNGQEILDATERLVAQANEAIDGTSLPQVSQVRPLRHLPKQADPWGLSSHTTRTTAVDWPGGEAFAPGLPGVYEAIQAIRRRGRDSDGSGLGPVGYENVIGYRLVELDSVGRSGDAQQAIFELADALPFGENPTLLSSLSDGFLRLGCSSLSAVAGVLAWTRTRAGGGWRSFGAEVNVAYLAQAFRADDAMAREALGREVARTAIDSFSSGPSQALIAAAGLAALPWSAGAADAAMRCWSAACDVLDRRTPRFPASDIPEYPYIPTLDLAVTQVEIDRCVAAVALARVCLPGREGKRRALIAITDLLQSRPDSILSDLGGFLVLLTDPITQFAVLSAAVANESIAERMRGALTELARSDLLAIRSMARAHLPDPPELPPCSPTPELLAVLRAPDWEPASNSAAEALVDEFLATRLTRASGQMPELEPAVFARIADDAVIASWRKRAGSQMESLASRARFRWPDAILSFEEGAERELQTLAGAARMARIVVGEPIVDPTEWEAVLADRLAPGGEVSLHIEATRIPRPAMPAAPHPDDAAWVADPKDERFQTIRGTDAPDQLDVDGWVAVGLIERREFDGQRYDENGPVSRTIGGVYSGVPDPRDIPLGSGPARWWRESGRHEPLSPYPFPLAAICSSSNTGLGAPESLLVPTPALRGALDLRPNNRPFSMTDETGEEVVRLVVWRAEYEVSDYELTYPRVQGQALVVRPDRFGDLGTQLPYELGWFMLRTLFVKESSDGDSG